MARGGKLVEFPGTSEAERTAISPELKSWIRRVIVPALVREWAVENRQVPLAPTRDEVIKSVAKSTATAERISG